ncbi:SPASM domain-containing protein [Blautia wexlerae]|nr:SPASM domain-containing protein [Blautia wexlerae]
MNGNVAFCCINQGKIIGNVFDKDLMEIWNNEQYLLTRQAFYQGDIPQLCSGCDFLVQNRLHYMSQQNYSLAGLKKGLRQ